MPAVDLWMDSRVPRPVCFVSHAHADHIGRHGAMIATPGTARLCAARQGAVPTLAVGFGERREMDGYALTPFPAGHCLGSAQLLVEHEGERFVYTGDFKLRPSRTSETPIVVPCDTLVMEVTFGDPLYRFPAEDAVDEMVRDEVDRALAAGEVPVVVGYALGKGQEALALLVEAGYDVAVHSTTMRIVRVYEELGVRFEGPGSFAAYERGRLDGKVFLVPPSALKTPMVQNLTRKRTLYLSGWGMQSGAHFRYRVDRVIPFSDHAGYDDLLRYVAESGARRVVTVHGKPDFGRVIRRELGVETCHLDERSPRAVSQPVLF